MVTQTPDDRGSKTAMGPDDDFSEESMWSNQIKPLLDKGLDAREISEETLIDEPWVEDIIERRSERSEVHELSQDSPSSEAPALGKEEPENVLNISISWPKDPHLLGNIVHDLGVCEIPGEPGDVIAVLLFNSPRPREQLLKSSPFGQSQASVDGVEGGHDYRGTVQKVRVGLRRVRVGLQRVRVDLQRVRAGVREDQGAVQDHDAVQGVEDEGLHHEKWHFGLGPVASRRVRRKGDVVVSPKTVLFPRLHEIGLRCSQIAVMVERCLRGDDIDQ